MEFAKGSDQELHDRLVKSIMTYCKENGYKNICVDLAGYNLPSKLGNHVPDLTAQTKDDAWLICEAEPCDNIDTDHTKEQMSDFARYTATVVLLVPKSCESLANGVLQKWGLSAKVKVWTVSGY